MIELRRSVAGCNCRHRKEPLALSIVVKVEHAKPELTFNGRPEDIGRLTAWLASRPELARLVMRAEELALEEEAA
jgi:hypothetical protein